MPLSYLKPNRHFSGQFDVDLSGMLPNFTDLTFLKSGSPVQQIAFRFLEEEKILYHLKPFHATLTGSLPIDLFITGKSDIDITCESTNFAKATNTLKRCFGDYSKFSIRTSRYNSVPSMICKFIHGGFPVEIFFQPLPVTAQWSYRHMVVEYKLLQKYGEDLRKAVWEFKHNGHSTESAFCNALNIPGEPYIEILKLEAVL